MKKRIVCAFLMAMMVLALPGCGNEKGGNTDQNAASVQTESSVDAAESSSTDNVGSSQGESEKDFDGSSYSEMGEGTFMICTAAGTSENGNVPVIYSEKDTILTQIGDSARDMNGNALTFIYIDGMLAAKEQMADYDGSLDLQGDNLAEGIHQVEAVQYEEDDPQKAVVTYKTGAYEVKMK